MQSLTGYSESSIRFMQKLETHLFERRNAIPRPYSDVPQELRARALSSSSTLATSQPKAAAMYGSYMSALSYDKKARFIAQSSDTMQSIAALRQVWQIG